MSVYTNYPIIKDAWDFEDNDHFKYIQAFNKHHISFVLISEQLLMTDHIYNDGLHVRIQWLIDKPNQLPSLEDIKDIEDLSKLQKNKVIHYSFVKVKRYSKESHNPTDEVHKKFITFLGNRQKNKKLDKQKYQRLEYSVSSPIKLSDHFFDKMIETNKKKLAFKEYLKSREEETK